GVDGGRVRPGGQVDGDGDVPGAQVHLGPVVPGGAAAADPHAVDGHVDPVRLEDRVGGADRGDDPAPIRVLPVDRALEQVRPGHGAAHGHRVLLGGGADHLDRDRLGRALGVDEELPAQVGADPGDHL